MATKAVEGRSYPRHSMQLVTLRAPEPAWPMGQTTALSWFSCPLMDCCALPSSWTAGDNTWLGEGGP